MNYRFSRVFSALFLATLIRSAQTSSTVSADPTFELPLQGPHLEVTPDSSIIWQCRYDFDMVISNTGDMPLVVHAIGLGHSYGQGVYGTAFSWDPSDTIVPATVEAGAPPIVIPISYDCIDQEFPSRLLVGVSSNGGDIPYGELEYWAPMLLVDVDGYVYDAATGQPIEGANVLLTEIEGERQSTLTDAQGHFACMICAAAGLAYGTATASADGYTPETFTFSGSGLVEHDFYLIPFTPTPIATPTLTHAPTPRPDGIYHVSTLGDDHSGDGSRERPFLTVTKAMELARGTAGAHAEVHVASGTYHENVVMDPYVNLRGGYHPQTWEQSVEVYATVIDASFGGRCIMAATGTIEGLTLINGRADTGAGIYVPSETRLVAENCTIAGNSAVSEGGGMYCFESSPTLTNCVLVDNACGFLGGGIYCEGGRPTLSGCTIVNNEAYFFGGLAFLPDSSPELINCVIAGNYAYRAYGGITTEGGSPLLINCTITGNCVGDFLGGGLTVGGGQPTVMNCILWDNYPDSLHGSAPESEIVWSDIQGGWEGEGNIDADPLFVRPWAWCDPWGGHPWGDLHLQATSPCIDSGTPDSEFNDRCRPPALGTERSDMGAYGGPGNCIWNPDTDADGIRDGLEVRVPMEGQTNMYLPDSDGDGLADGTEDANRDGAWAQGTETNARSRDTDGDQYEDGIEVLIQHFYTGDPLDPGVPGDLFKDTDGDSLADSLEPTPSAITNPDWDEDRFTDGYEFATTGNIYDVLAPDVHPSLGDLDLDGVWDNADAQHILNFFARHSTPGTYPGLSDLDRNAFIDNADCQYSLNYFAQLTPYLPAK